MSFQFDVVLSGAGRNFIALLTPAMAWANSRCTASQGLLLDVIKPSSGHDTAGVSPLYLDWLLLERRRLGCLLAGVELSHEGFAHLLGVEAGLVEPRVCLELVDGVAVTAIVAEELKDHVLEVG